MLDVLDHDHGMLTDIHQQPTALRATLAGRVAADDRLRLDVEPPDGCADVSRLMIIGGGTSVHAGMSARAALEQWAGVPVTVELAGGFRHREPVVPPGTLVVAISQSGETADTLAAMQYAQAHGARVLALTDTVGSTLTHDADMVLYTHIGPEGGTTATKAFTCQVAALALLALWLGQQRGHRHRRALLAQFRDLVTVPALVGQTIDAVDSEVRELADELATAHYVTLVGRHLDLPVALEGALKLREVTSVRADGFAAGEMKHGPVALMEVGGPVVALATAEAGRDAVIFTISQARARGVPVIAVAVAGDVDMKEHADRVLFVPSVEGLWSPIVTVVPLQLLSYHLAVALGRDVDKPRKAARKVTAPR